MRAQVLFGLLALVTGCSREGDAQRGASASSKAGAAATGTPPAISAGASAARDPEIEQVRALLQEWRATQEKLDFERYSALYAAAFRGVKQVGDRRFRFDRRGWLADRQGMFKPGLSLKVSGVELVRVERSVAAFFTQEFSSPSFRDRGRKVLVFSRASDGASGWRIVREEMLSSEVLGGGGSVSALSGFFFARPDAVVLRSSVEERWLTPARLELSRAFRAAVADPEGAEWPSEGFLTLADLRLPPEVTAFRGKKLYVTRAPAKGATSVPPPCEVTVTRVDVANTGTEAFESTRAARGEDHVYGSVLLGRFEQRCEGALWASETPPKEQFLPTEAPSDLLAVALRELRRLPEAEKRGFARGGTESGSLQALLLGDPAKQRLLFVALERDAWSESYASMSALFELPPASSSAKLLGVVATDTSLKPVLAFDSNADGELEILAEESDDDASWHVIQKRAGKVSSSRVYFTPNFVCPG